MDRAPESSPMTRALRHMSEHVSTRVAMETMFENAKATGLVATNETVGRLAKTAATTTKTTTSTTSTTSAMVGGPAAVSIHAALAEHLERARLMSINRLLDLLTAQSRGKDTRIVTRESRRDTDVAAVTVVDVACRVLESTADDPAKHADARQLAMIHLYNASVKLVHGHLSTESNLFQRSAPVLVRVAFQEAFHRALQALRAARGASEQATTTTTSATAKATDTTTLRLLKSELARLTARGDWTTEALALQLLADWSTSVRDETVRCTRVRELVGPHMASLFDSIEWFLERSVRYVSNGVLLFGIMMNRRAQASTVARTPSPEDEAHHRASVALLALPTKASSIESFFAWLDLIVRAGHWLVFHEVVDRAADASAEPVASVAATPNENMALNVAFALSALFESAPEALGAHGTRIAPAMSLLKRLIQVAWTHSWTNRVQAMIIDAISEVADAVQDEDFAVAVWGSVAPEIVRVVLAYDLNANACVAFDRVRNANARDPSLSWTILDTAATEIAAALSKRSLYESPETQRILSGVYEMATVALMFDAQPDSDSDSDDDSDNDNDNDSDVVAGRAPKPKPRSPMYKSVGDPSSVDDRLGVQLLRVALCTAVRADLSVDLRVAAVHWIGEFVETLVRIDDAAAVDDAACALCVTDEPAAEALRAVLAWTDRFALEVARGVRAKDPSTLVEADWLLVRAAHCVRATTRAYVFDSSMSFGSSSAAACDAWDWVAIDRKWIGGHIVTVSAVTPVITGQLSRVPHRLAVVDDDASSSSSTRLQSKALLRSTETEEYLWTRWSERCRTWTRVIDSMIENVDTMMMESGTTTDRDTLCTAIEVTAAVYEWLQLNGTAMVGAWARRDTTTTDDACALEESTRTLDDAVLRGLACAAKLASASRTTPLAPLAQHWLDQWFSVATSWAVGAHAFLQTLPRARAWRCPMGENPWLRPAIETALVERNSMAALRMLTAALITASDEAETTTAELAELYATQTRKFLDAMTPASEYEDLVLTERAGRNDGVFGPLIQFARGHPRRDVLLSTIVSVAAAGLLVRQQTILRAVERLEHRLGVSSFSTTVHRILSDDDFFVRRTPETSLPPTPSARAFEAASRRPLHVTTFLSARVTDA